MTRRLAAVAAVLMLGMALVLPATATAGEVVGRWSVDGRIDQKKAKCEWVPEPTVTVDTVSWPAECTGKKKKSGKVLYTLTITDPLGVVADQCTQQVAVPKKQTVSVGCSMPNPGIPVD